MSWVSVRYHPASFFSLRPAQATASGGKSLLCPTAYAIKMALLNASIQMAGVIEGERRFPLIRDLRIALRLPPTITALKSFAKIRRPARISAATRDDDVARLSNAGQYPFQSTIAYREFIQFGDPARGLDSSVVEIACGGPDAPANPPAWLSETLLAINYLGKRGGFWQPLSAPVSMLSLEPDYIEITRDSDMFSMEGTLQMLDDCGSRLTFQQANIYSTSRVTLGEGRVLRHVVLPYRLERSSRGYSRYTQVGAGRP